MKSNELRFAFRILLFGVSLQLPLQGLAVTVANLNDTGPGSIRQAIADTPAGGIIDFAVTGNILLTSGQLVIDKDLTVIGPAATKLTLRQNSTNRILLVSSGNVSISNLTIANGNCLGYEDGGGIKNLATLTLRNCMVSSNFAHTGGGLVNWGTLVLYNCNVSSNSSFSAGGGILNSTSLAIIGSTITGNAVVGQDAVLYGGGVHTAGSLIISNSTISSNPRACGIACFWGTVAVTSCTIASNGSYGLLKETSDPNSTVTIHNSIFSGSDGGRRSDCAGRFVSQDYNLIQNNYVDPFYNVAEAKFTGATNHNIYGQDPKLGPLADNSGPTPTHALRFDSPAIDAGSSGGAITDQRGQLRPIDDPNTINADNGDGSDIGAYEADPILKVTGFEISGAKVKVGFNSMLGRNYSLESEGNMDNSWTTLSNNIAGSGNAVQKVNAGYTSPTRQFYRVELLP